MRGCLEFIEDLWVGDCDPVEELGELLVDYFGIDEFDLQYVEFALNQTEVAVSHFAEIVQCADVEHFAAVASSDGGW